MTTLISIFISGTCCYFVGFILGRNVKIDILKRVKQVSYHAGYRAGLEAEMRPLRTQIK